MKVLSIAVLLLQFATAAAAQFPSPAVDDVQIVVGGFEISANGGEKRENISHIVMPTSAKPYAAEWSMWDCGFLELSVAHDGFREGATVGWRVEITPIRVVNRAVTFRLRWVRALDRSKESTFAGEDVELTLRPGEERTVDRVPVPPGAMTFDSKVCRTSATGLKVFVENYPREDVERRLIAADMWLVERLRNGSERSQPLLVRGLPNSKIPFYFDGIADGPVSLEVFGQVVARPESGGVEVSLQTRSRWGATSFNWQEGGEWPTKWLESTIHMKPQEIVEVALPKLGKEAGPFADRVFAIRIRARQVR